MSEPITSVIMVGIKILKPSDFLQLIFVFASFSIIYTSSLYEQKPDFHRRGAEVAKAKKIGHRFTQIKHRLKLFFNPKNLRLSASKLSLLFSSLRSLRLCGL